MAKEVTPRVMRWSPSSNGGSYRTGIGGIEMCHVYISMQVPVFSHFISQLGISAVLFKSHIGPMPVGPIVGARYHTREPSLADTVGEFRFQRVIRTITRMKMCIDLPASSVSQY